MSSDQATAEGSARPGRGRPALQPEGFYAPEPAVRTVSEALVVAFQGEDRSSTYSFGQLPCPGLHADLAAAFTVRIGPTGDRRTKASADTAWAALVRFLKFLDELRRPPRSLAELRKSHLQRFRLRRLETVSEQGALGDVMEIHRLLREVEPQSRLRGDVVEVIHQRVRRVNPHRPRAVPATRIGSSPRL
jgi:hypothetical protein